MPSLTNRYSVLDENPSPRMPVCFLLDTSYSMNTVTGGVRTGQTIERDGEVFELVRGENLVRRIDHLNTAVSKFATDILHDVRAAASVELAILTFDESLKIVRDFSPIDATVGSLSLQCGGNATRLGQGVKTALELLDQRKKDYVKWDIQCYQPQLVIMTDGAATDPDLCQQVGPDLQQRMRRKSLVSLPFLIGDQTNTGSLHHFAPLGHVFRTEGTNLAAIFKYLSQSAIAIQNSVPGGSGELTLQQMVEGLQKVLVPVGDLK